MAAARGMQFERAADIRAPFRREIQHIGMFGGLQQKDPARIGRRHITDRGAVDGCHKFGAQDCFAAADQTGAVRHAAQPFEEILPLVAFPLRHGLRQMESQAAGEKPDAANGPCFHRMKCVGHHQQFDIRPARHQLRGDGVGDDA